MSTVDDRPMAEAGGPEEPTNRPPALHRFKMWYSRHYAKTILWLSVLIALLMFPLAFLVIHIMNLSGGPASSIMGEIEKTMFVFTILSGPLIGITLAIILYSLFGWGGIRSETPPMQESPAIRTNRLANFLWITATSVLAFILVVWGVTELATITADSYGATPANAQPSAQKPLIVNVTGQQWVWTFQYPDNQNVSTPTLVVPLGRPVYFNVTSKDVVHNFWVVELGVKIDANPGAVTNTGVTPNKLGTFNVRCAELCGLHHAYMETTVQVVTPEQFDSWVRESGGKRTA